jgi:hypothetical protein
MDKVPFPAVHGGAYNRPQMGHTVSQLNPVHTLFMTHYLCSNLHAASQTIRSLLILTLNFLSFPHLRNACCMSFPSHLSAITFSNDKQSGREGHTRRIHCLRSSTGPNKLSVRPESVRSSRTNRLILGRKPVMLKTTQERRACHISEPLTAASDDTEVRLGPVQAAPNTTAAPGTLPSADLSEVIRHNGPEAGCRSEGQVWLQLTASFVNDQLITSTAFIMGSI